MVIVITNESFEAIVFILLRHLRLIVWQNPFTVWAFKLNYKSSVIFMKIVDYQIWKTPEVAFFMVFYPL